LWRARAAADAAGFPDQISGGGGDREIALVRFAGRVKWYGIGDQVKFP
jgi:hypothetical protein